MIHCLGILTLALVIGVLATSFPRLEQIAAGSSFEAAETDTQYFQR